MAELKPCPFCGGEAKLFWDSLFAFYEVKCKRCYSHGARHDGREEAIEAWNRRTEDGK